MTHFHPALSPAATALKIAALRRPAARGRRGPSVGLEKGLLPLERGGERGESLREGLEPKREREKARGRGRGILCRVYLRREGESGGGIPGIDFLGGGEGGGGGGGGRYARNGGETWCVCFIYVSPSLVLHSFADL